MRQWSILGAMICLLSACGAPAPANQATASVVVEATTIPAPVTPVPTATIASTATPAPVWKDKLNGLWNQQNNRVAAQWLIDLDAGELRFTSTAGDSGEPTIIEFDHEDSKTVYVQLHGEAGERLDTFRFVNDDTVQWTQGEKEEKILLTRVD